MKSKDMIKKLMAEEGITQGELAKRVGYKRQQNIGGVLNRYESMRVDVLVKLLSAMGCRLVVMRGNEKIGEITDDVTPKKKAIDTDTIAR